MARCCAVVHHPCFIVTVWGGVFGPVPSGSRKGCSRREGVLEDVPEAGGCRGLLKRFRALSVGYKHSVEAGSCSGWATGGAHHAARSLGNYRETGEIVPFCTCGSLMAKWTYAFGAHLGLSHASCRLPSYFLPPKLGKTDAVLITLNRINLTLRHLRRSCSAHAARSKRSHRLGALEVGYLRKHPGDAAGSGSVKVGTSRVRIGLGFRRKLP